MKLKKKYRKSERGRGRCVTECGGRKANKRKTFAFNCVQNNVENVNRFSCRFIFVLSNACSIHPPVRPLIWRWKKRPKQIQSDFVRFVFIVASRKMENGVRVCECVFSLCKCRELNRSKVPFQLENCTLRNFAWWCRPRGHIELNS